MIFTDPSPDSEYENVLQPDIHLMTKHNYGRATGRSRKPTCELLKCQHAHSACHELPTLGLSPPKTRLCLIQHDDSRTPADRGWLCKCTVVGNCAYAISLLRLGPSVLVLISGYCTHAVSINMNVRAVPLSGGESECTERSHIRSLE